MNLIIDIIIGVVMLAFLVMGIKKGFIRQVLEIVGIIAAFVGSFLAAHYLGEYLERRFELSYDLSLIIAALALFFGILVLFHFLGLFLQKIANITLLGSFDRVGGGIFGLLKGALLVSLLLVITLNLPLPGKYKKELREDPVAAALYPVLPTCFDLILSRSPVRLDFGRVTRSDLGDLRNDANRKAEKLKEGLKRKKEQAEEAQKKI